jgi:hypothetical protein
MAENDESSLLKKAKQVGDQVSQAAGEVSRLKDVASHAVENAVTEANDWPSAVVTPLKTWLTMLPIASSATRFARSPSAWRLVCVWAS